jgi:hypothetical protein
MLPARDDFAGTSGALAAPNWAQQSTAGSVTRNGSGLASSSGSGGLVRWIADSFNAAHYSQVTIIGGLVAGTALVEVETRASGVDATLSGYLAYTDGASGGAGLQKYVNAVLSPVRTYAGTINSGKFRLESRLTTHEAFIGDVSLGTATDSSLTTGTPGFSIVSTATADDFEGGNVGAASTVAPTLVSAMRPLRAMVGGLVGHIALALRAAHLARSGSPQTFTLPLSVGTYSLTGQSVGLATTHRVPLAAGVYSLTGQNVALYRALSMPAVVGTYALNGQAVRLAASRRVALANAAYALNGQSVVLRASRALPLANATYVLNGQAVRLAFLHRIVLANGVYSDEEQQRRHDHTHGRTRVVRPHR